MFTNRYIGSRLYVSIIVLGMFFSTVVVRAAGTSHFLGVSVGMGTSLSLNGGDAVNVKPGFDGQASFSYEVVNRGFFFNVGVGADYQLTREGLAGTMVDQYGRVDKWGAPIWYRWIYNDYREAQHTLYASLPIQLGYIIKDRVYIGVGAKFTLPLWNQYEVSTRLYTEGEYVNLIAPISRNVPSYGYYAEDDYSSKGTYVGATAYVSPTIEVGAQLPVTRKVSCRIGLFAEYAIPFLGSHEVVPALVDYSSVDLNVQTQNQDNLRENIRFVSLMNAALNPTFTEHGGESLYKGLSQNLSIGVKATFRFDVTKKSYPCRCAGHYRNNR